MDYANLYGTLQHIQMISAACGRTIAIATLTFRIEPSQKVALPTAANQEHCSVAEYNESDDPGYYARNGVAIKRPAAPRQLH